MRTGVRRLVEVDDSVLQILGQGSIQWSGAHRDRGVMRRPDVQLVEILTLFALPLTAMAILRRRSALAQNSARSWLLSFLFYPYLYKYLYKLYLYITCIYGENIKLRN